MQTPADRYRPSERAYRGRPELDYPLHDRTVTFTTCGRICMHGALGFFDNETCRLEPLANPSEAHAVLIMPRK